MNLYYITNSVPGSKAANSIQTANMYRAIKELGVPVISFWYGDRSFPYWRNGCFYIPGSILKGLLFAALSSVFIAVHSKFVQNYLVLSRNQYSLLFLRLFRLRNLVFEVHSIPKSRSKWIFKKLVNSQNIKIISITNALASKIYNEFEPRHPIIVLPDAHPIPKSIILNRLKECSHKKINQKRGGKLKVGYYGSLKDYKGFGIIKTLVLQYHKEFHFVIRSKEEVPAELKPKLFKSGYIPHELALEEMQECNCLLLPLESTGKENDISDVTSPLKLFEYLASGSPIIASRKSVLQEILKEDKNCLMAADVEEFYKKIKLIEGNPSLSLGLVSNGLEDSLLYSYDSRAQKLLGVIT